MEISPMPNFFKETALWLRYSMQYANPIRAVQIARRNSALHERRAMLPVELVFTADVEFTPPWQKGDWVKERIDYEARIGLDVVLKILRNIGIKGTFLIEGSLAEKESSVIQTILSSNSTHEIGYHGWAHESYGGPWETNTKVQPEVLKPDAVLERIVRGSKVIGDQAGKNPASFVAPFHHMRQSTLESLGRCGFKADSSVYNHAYGLREAFMVNDGLNGIVEIPFAIPFDPVFRFGSPFYPTLLEYVERTQGDISGQVKLMSDALPDSAERLVILVTCHPWEFAEENGTKAAALMKLLTFLTTRRSNTTLTMSEVRPSR